MVYRRSSLWIAFGLFKGHKNILHLGTGRPFSSIEEMEEKMIENWNRVVQQKDTVYYLGDLAFKSRDKDIERTLRDLNGVKILITGNHDAKVVRRSKAWQHVWDYREIKIEGQRIILSHYPFQEWNGSWRGTYHLHGHCHGNLPVDETLKRIDVGVDCHNYTPINFERIKEIMQLKLPRE